MCVDGVREIFEELRRRDEIRFVGFALQADRDDGVFQRIRRDRSSSGRPNNVRNTCDGKGVARSAMISHSLRPAIDSMMSVAWACRDGITDPRVCGLKNGYRILRYRVCSGGSTASGISGTGLTIPSNWRVEENTAELRSAARTSCVG